MFLVKNGKAVAKIANGIATNLKEARASYQSTTDALNAQYPQILVNAETYKVSKNKKYEKFEFELPLATQKEGFRDNEFLLV